MVGGGPHAQRQQPHQRCRRHELGQRFVGEAGQLVPEGAGQQCHPRRGLAEVAARKAVHAGRDRQRERAEQQLYAAYVPERLAESYDGEQLEHRGHGTRHQP